MRELSIRLKFNVLVVILLILFGTTIFFVLNGQLKVGAEKGALEKVYSDLTLGYELIDVKYPGDWLVEGDTLYKGEQIINGNEQLVDEIADMTNGTVTIFLKDTRIATNVIIDGKRAVGTTVSDEVAKVVLKDGENFYGEANVVGNLYQAGYQPIKDNAGEIIGIWYVGAPQSFIDEILATGFIRTTGIIIAGVIIVTIVMIWYTGRFTNRLKQIYEYMNRAGDGDFSGQLADLGGDEVGKLGTAYNQMSTRLKGLIQQIQETGFQVNDASISLSLNAEETSRAADQIAQAVTEVSAGSDEQVNKSRETVKVSDQISEVMNETKASIQQASQEASLSADAANTGRQIMRDASEQMNALAVQNKEISLIIQRLRDKSLEINNILTLIAAVADQTNLLALNAAIEAARAGEHGRGFAVVAEEVRKLAEQTTQSSMDVSKIIEEIQLETEAAVQAMENGESTTKDSEELVLKADQSFGNITESFKELSSELERLVAGAEVATNGTSELVQTAQNVEEISEDANSHLQNVAASIEEQNASMQEIASNAIQLEQVSKKLAEAVKVFKV